MGKWIEARESWDEKVLFNAFHQELKALAAAKETVAVDLTPLQMWALLSTIQLACRHPLFRGPTRMIVEGIAQYLQHEVAPAGALAEIAARGWHRAWDAPPSDLPTPRASKLAMLATDRFFEDSPDAGTPACLCSRCGQPIAVGEGALRMWVDDRVQVKGEYRYHAACLGIPPQKEEPDA